MDERLVIPNFLRPIIKRSLHFGHTGRDSMLATLSNVWWPRLHREVGIAKASQQFQVAGKNIKPLLRKNQIGKLPKCVKKIQTIVIDFAGPFQNPNKANKYLIVSIDHFRGWPEAKFLWKPDTDKVLAFSKECIERHGIPQTIWTDSAIIFRSKRFKEFCKKRYIKNVECPIRDYKGIGKIERLIRTINERLRANTEIKVRKDISRQSEIRFALRMNPSAKNKSPYEQNTGRELNTIKRIITNKPKCISEKPEFPLTDDDFESRQDSTILVRERSRGSKLEGNYQKRKGVLLKQSNHTITFLPAGRTTKTLISKRDIGHSEQPTVLFQMEEKITTD